MWGLAAAFGPVGWVVAAVGTAATAYALMDDDDDEYTYSNKGKREAEVRSEAKAEKDKRIHKDIKQYKKQQKTRFKKKYVVDIEFIAESKDQQDKIKITKNNNENIDEVIEKAENEINDMVKLIEILEVMKHEAIS